MPEGRTRGYPVYGLIGRSYVNNAGEAAGETVVAMFVSREVAKVELVTEPSGSIFRKTAYLDHRRQRKARVPAMRYVAFPYEEDICVQSIAGFNSGGEELFKSKFEEC
ncbi:MAG: hypothetical protein ACTHN7_03265 [Solirubrobacterales bacterium]